MTTNFLPTSYADRPAFHPDELLPQEEVDATIEREEREALAYARANRKVRPIGGRRVKYSDEQDRDESGRWTSGGDEAIVGITAEDQAREAAAQSPLDRAIYARTGGGNYSEADHKLIVAAVQAAPAEAPELYRGFPMNESNGWTPEQTAAFTSQLEPGATIEMRLGSFSEDKAVIGQFAGVDEDLKPVGGVGSTMPPIEGGADAGIMADIAREEGFFITPTGAIVQPTDERVVLTVEPGARALDMQTAGAEDFADQREWATVGSFRVESVEHEGTVWDVKLTQLDTVEPERSDDAGRRQNGLPLGAGDE